MTKLVAFAGSFRAGSVNKKLLAAAVEAARAAGAAVEVVELKSLELPIYDGDIEDASGLPDGAKRFKAQLAGAAGMIVATPEYNSSISPALKNTIDWATRPNDLSGFNGKVALLLAASPGDYGGMRGLMAVRSILSSVGTYVLREQVALPRAHEAFDDAGRLKDARHVKAVEAGVSKLVTLATKLT